MKFPAIRALYLLPRADYGPDTLLVEHLLAHLPRGAVEPAVCFLEDGPVAERWATLLDVRPRALAPSGRPGSRRRAVETLVAIARTAGVQVLHAIGPAAQLVAARAAKDAGVPSVWSQAGVTRWGRWRDLRASLGAARAVMLHSALGEHSQRRLLVGRSRCHRVTAGVGLPDRLLEHRRTDARAALGLEPEALVAASIGPLDDPGAHESFLRAGTSLCHAREHAELVIAGTTGSLDTCKPLASRAAALGLGRRTRVVPPWDLAAALDAADIAVHAGGGAAEPLVPVALLQALAAGCAVIAHDDPLLHELVEPGVTALHAPSGDHEALALLLLALADDPAHRHRLAVAAAATARERHDADRMAAEVIALYLEVLAA